MLPERITTAEQLDELPEESVVVLRASDSARTMHIAMQKVGTEWLSWTWPTLFGRKRVPALLRNNDAFVVWKPGQPTDGEVQP